MGSPDLNRLRDLGQLKSSKYYQGISKSNEKKIREEKIDQIQEEIGKDTKSKIIINNKNIEEDKKPEEDQVSKGEEGSKPFVDDDILGK